MQRILQRFYMLAIVLALPVCARSPFREPDHAMPEITTYWADDPAHTYSLKNSHIERHSIFDIFNKEHFYSRTLPHDEIPFRYEPSQTVHGDHLHKLVDDLLDELKKTRFQKKSFTHFIVLKSRDYNPRTHSGLIVLKFKDYPFVVKIFMETPESYVRPFSKGIEPAFMFTIGRGTTRHGSGFTRIPNLENIQSKIKSDPHFSTFVDTPRKWYFHSKKCRWIVIEGKNIGTIGELKCEVPGTYAIICDAIDEHPTERPTHKKNKQQAIAICHFLESSIDAHINNFMIEKSTNKIVIIDTEHLPSLVGLDEPIKFTNYGSYYAQLAKKYIQDSLFRTKKQRRDAQYNEASPLRKSIIKNGK